MRTTKARDVYIYNIYIHVYTCTRAYYTQPAMDQEAIGASSVLMHCVCMQHSFLSSIADLHPTGSPYKTDEYVLHDDYILITIHSCSVLLLL